MQKYVQCRRMGWAADIIVPCRSFVKSVSTGRAFLPLLMVLQNGGEGNETGRRKTQRWRDVADEGRIWKMSSLVRAICSPFLQS